MTYISNRDFITEVNKGNVPGHRMLGVVARSNNVQTSWSDVWEGGGDMVYPTAGETWEIVCSNGNDTAAGTGAQEVTIVSLDASGNEQVFVESTNGGTKVIAGTHYDIQSINVTATGTTRGFNEGDITLQVSGGGNVRGRILAGAMSDYNSHYVVPNGYTAFWIEAFVNSEKGEDTEVRPLVQIGGSGVFFIGATSSTYQNQYVYPFKTFLVLTEGSRILQQAKTTNAGSSVTTILELMLVENEYVNSANTAVQNWII